MYCNDKTILYLIAMLKAYGIRHIVASPGTQNGLFNASVQEDEFFDCYSVIDERSAAYTAVGMAAQLGGKTPVVITCTGATASRNYLPALTEAFYRHLPVIALTFTHHQGFDAMECQSIDRSISQNDVKVLDVNLPLIDTDDDKRVFIQMMHSALTTAVRGLGPVHINCIQNYDFSFDTKNLPTDVYKIDCFDSYFDADELAGELSGAKSGVFIGSHKKFSPRLEQLIGDFAEKFGVPVYCDHSANYHGKNKILCARAQWLARASRPEILIDIGDVMGDYSAPELYSKAKMWRVSGNGKFVNRHGHTRKFFDCPEELFFERMNSVTVEKKSEFYSQVKKCVDEVVIPELPLSSPLIAQYLAKYLPRNSNLHLGILNSLRHADMFDLDKSIDVFANVGGFGIDGAVSALIGQSWVSTEKLNFGFIGDLAFFYDMNILGNRHVGKNIRILLVNNNCGVEFRVNPVVDNPLGEKVDVLIDAAGHNAGGACGWAKSCGFHYMSAKTKDEFLSQINEFCNGEFDSPVLFEVFTTTADEQNGKNAMLSLRDKNKEKSLHRLMRHLKGNKK